MFVAYIRAKAAIPATTATTFPPTVRMLAAPLKVVAGVVVVEVVEEGEVVAMEVVATDAVDAGTVALPAGKGTGVTVVDVAGGGTGTGVVEVEVEVEEVAGGGTATGVEEVDVVLDVVEELELEPPAMGPVPVPTQGKVTM